MAFSRTQYFEFGNDAALQIERLIKAVRESNDTSLHEKLDTLTARLAGVPAEIDLLKQKLDLIHGLLTVDTQEKIDEITGQLKPEADALEGSAQKEQQ